MLPKPEYPIDCIAIDYKTVYETLYADSAQYTFPCGRYVPEMRIAITEEMSKTVFDALYAWGKAAGYIDDSDDPKPTKVIFNGPATVTFFDDGTKVVTKAKDGDEFDPLFGIIACMVRKVGKNRVTVDSWEPFIQFLAENLGSAKECRFLADVLNATADAWDLDWVDESMGEWAEQKADESFDACFGEADDTETNEDKARCERTRQTIRDLMDRGEL